MDPIVKKVLYGAKQEAVLTPKEGYEVESVEVFNKTTNEVVPSQLTKTSDNPPQWTCTFSQPAGVVAVRPKMRPIYYAVIIEECEHCSIVLMESNDVVDVKITAVNNADVGTSVPNNTDSQPDEPELDSAALENSGTPVVERSETAPTSDEPNPAAANVDAEVLSSAEQEGDTNFNIPQHSEHTEETSPADMSVEDNHTEETTEPTQDVAYDAGEFQEELEEVEPTVLSREEYDRRCASYWQHHKAFFAGQIDKEVYNDVLKKHNAFMEDISTGRIVIEG